MTERLEERFELLESRVESDVFFWSAGAVECAKVVFTLSLRPARERKIDGTPIAADGRMRNREAR
jgi:hypothetical protein